MRPLQLRLTAFGSYPGTEIVDFEALAARGLFVVSGDTGTGKTTIFDAMCWALFGTMPGKHTGEVRSHHVPDGVRTEVQFTFECGGERYVVTRNPEQLRPSQRGSRLAKEPPGASLARLANGATESLATKPTDVTRRCIELVGLGAEQFQRVVLLPQGEFSRFLLASTAEREPLLSQLFGGEVFDRIIEELKQDRDTLSEEVGDTDRQLTEHLNAARSNIERAAAALGIDEPDDLTEADRAALGSMRTALDEPLATLRTRVETLDQHATRLATSQAEQQAAARRFDDATQLRTALDAMAVRTPKVEADATAATRSAAARPVVTADDVLTEARRRASESQEQLSEVRRTIEALFEPFDVAVDTTSANAVTAAVAEQRQRVAAQHQALVALKDARTAVEQASKHEETLIEHTAAAEATRTSAEDRLVEIEQRLAELRHGGIDPTAVDAQITTAVELVATRAALDEELGRHHAAAAAAEQATTRYRTLLDTFIRTQAPRLADRLVDGEPCPVCGSADHPAPAVPDDGEAVGFDDVERASEEREATNGALTKIAAAVAELRGALGDEAETPLDELRARQTVLEEQRTAAVAAANEVEQLTAEQTTVTNRATEAREELARLSGDRQRARKDAVDATEKLDAATTAAAGLDPDEVDRRDELLTALDTRCVELQDLAAAVNTDKGSVEQAERSRAAALAASPFDAIEAARAELLTEQEEVARLDAKKRFDEDRLKATSKLADLDEQGIPDQRPDVEAVRREAEAAKAAHHEAAQTLTTATDAVTYLDTALAHHDSLLESSGETRQKLEVAQRAYTVARNGGRGVEMSLKRWVLTRELDQVTAAANVHLHRMTGQRYTLQRRDDRTDGRKVFGLDLEVLDAQTGRARSTSSLSGGEQFQASLALALGLADVVSQGGASSGKRFEALFVDEGFGSLSAEALEDAIETLYQLHATGRMVGAITHVDAMKQQLHVGIEVRRRPDGAGSTLVVHP